MKFDWDHPPENEVCQCGIMPDGVPLEPCYRVGFADPVEITTVRCRQPAVLARRTTVSCSGVLETWIYALCEEHKGYALKEKRQYDEAVARLDTQLREQGSLPF
jgi:hypothetical protein